MELKEQIQAIENDKTVLSMEEFSAGAAEQFYRVEVPLSLQSSVAEVGTRIDQLLPEHLQAIQGLSRNSLFHARLLTQSSCSARACRPWYTARNQAGGFACDGPYRNACQ